MSDPTTVRSRELGAELRRRREEANWTLRELSRKLGWSHTSLSHMELGHRGISEVQLAIYLTTIGIRDPRELQALLSLRRDAELGYHVRPHGEQLPDELLALTIHETKAIGIQQYEPLVIPGLLQTEVYARAAFVEGDEFPEDGIEKRVRARLERQGVLNRPDMTFTVFIHEQALRLPVGGPQVMHEQMLHLMFRSSNRRLSIRVVPFKAGARSGMTGPFEFLDCAEDGPVIYLENDTMSLFLEKQSDIDFYRNALNRLDRVALDEAESRQMFVELANEYDLEEASHRDERAGQGQHELDELAEE